MTKNPPSEPATNSRKYQRDTVGFVMTEHVPVVFPDQLVQEVYEYLHAHAPEFETINYVYVVDHDRTLLGVLSVREIFSVDRTKKCGDVCIRSPLFTVHPEAHQERAAYLSLRHGIKAIPVIDREKKFVGEITANSILKILHKEMHEDSLRRAGIRHPMAVRSTVLTLSFLDSFKHRIPWLLLGLIGGVLAAKVITLFEAVLSKNLVLAAFIPLIVYMSSAVGTQMEAYIIRDLAVEKELPFTRYLLRHFVVVFLIGLLLGLLLFCFYGFASSDWFLALVLSLSLFGAILSSVCTGLIVPYAFSKFSLDPADASGPIGTIVQDILSILIYFGIANALL